SPGLALISRSWRCFWNEEEDGHETPNDLQPNIRAAPHRPPKSVKRVVVLIMALPARAPLARKALYNGRCEARGGGGQDVRSWPRGYKKDFGSARDSRGAAVGMRALMDFQ